MIRCHPAIGGPAVYAAIASGDLASAIDMALILLEQLPPKDQGTARAAMDLIVACRRVIENGPPLYPPAGHKVHFDGRTILCFEWMLGLVRRQNRQIAELQAILADLISAWSTHESNSRINVLTSSSPHRVLS